MTNLVRVRFNPQAWVNDYTMAVDPEGPTEWLVECSLVETLKDDTYESDNLRHHANAPAWVKEWSGPFYIEILNGL